MSESDFVDTFKRRAESDALQHFASESGKSFLIKEAEKQGKTIKKLKDEMVSQVRKMAGRRAKKLHRNRHKKNNRRVETPAKRTSSTTSTAPTSSTAKACDIATDDIAPSTPGSTPSRTTFKTLKLEKTGLCAAPTRP